MDMSVRSESIGQGDQSWLGSRHSTDNAKSVTVARAALTALTHYPDGYLKSGTPMAKATSGTYSGFWVPLAARANEVQTVTITGAPTGGTFTLTLDGETSAAIAYNATAAAVQTALEAMSNVAPGDVTVAGGPGPGAPYVATFTGARSGTDVPAFTASSSLTGGTSPAVGVATTTGGGSAAADGSDVLDGFLLTDVSVPPGSTGNVAGPLVWHGRIIAANLPFPVSTAAQKAAPSFVFN